MIPISMLVSTHTISQEHVRLSASHPVQLQRLHLLAEGNPPHDHDFTEICLILSGTVEHHTENGTESCGPGTVIVVQPGAIHGFSHPSDAEVINIYYLSEWLLYDLRYLWDMSELMVLFVISRLFRKINAMHTYAFSLSITEQKTALYEIHALERELQLADPSPLYLKSCFTKLLIQLSRSFQGYAPQDRGIRWLSEFRPEVNSVLVRIERIIIERKPFILSELRDITGLSPDYASKVFRDSTGWAPQEYYQRRRVQHACNLLLNPMQQIGDIVFDLGYADAAHFCRMFKRIAGLTPSAYRKRYR